MLAVLKREIKSYFSSPVGYVCVAALTAVYGLFFYSVLLSGSSSYIPSAFNAVYMFAMMIIPIITMRSMSEDRKNKTDQALLTAPVGVFSIVSGKFLAAFFVYFLGTFSSILFSVIIGFFSAPSWPIIIGNYIAALLYGAAMISIGIFISSLTISQVIAAIGTFAISIFLMFIENIASALASTPFITVVDSISFTAKYVPFTQGIFSISGLVYFLSIVAVFMFLTARKLESRRWS